VESKSEYTSRLAAELLDDIELNRLTTDALLLKVSRLARLAGDHETVKWLTFEQLGYNTSDPVSLKYMGRTGRWTDYKEKKGYWGPLAQQEAAIESCKERLKAFTTQGLGGDAAIGVITRITQTTTSISTYLSAVSGIRSRVIALMHAFVVGVHYEAIFSSTAESIFQQFRAAVDPLLQVAAADLPERMATSYARLGESNAESTSAALNTCRRVIDAFSDAIFPAREGTFSLDGNELQLSTSHHLNRLNASIATRVESKSRRKRLRQSLANTYDRVSAGIHNDIEPDEARALILSTYVLLGEIALLPSPRPPDGS
jgi:hypothetical protein